MITSLTKQDISTTISGDLLVSVLTSGQSLVTTLGIPGPQGSQGIQGESGEIVNADQFFQTSLKFAELDTPQKKIDARTNLELQYIDCGEFF